jgi:tetratricopeptide (TPR) repeat protein
MRRLFATVCLALCAGSIAEAQRYGPAPKRPRDASIPDSNDARAYLSFGQRAAETDPDAAVAAFYWAARLDPMSGDALYGLAMTRVMRSRPLLATWMRGGRFTLKTKDLRAIDSLLFRAHVLDPFLNRRLERPMFMAYIRNDVEQRTRGSREQISPGELDFAINSYLSSAGPETQAWMAHADGDMERSLSLYADAMKREKSKSWYQIERGRIFGRLARSDSAISQFQSALVELRAADAKDLVILYNSKAVLEHSIAVMLEQKDDVAGAREAYGRALQEDLSYYPAHLRLGMLATTSGDTSTAVSELDLAVQIAPEEPHVRLMFASALISMGSLDRALPHLKKAVEVEPNWATPYVGLAQLLERASDGPGALAAYNGYFAHAPANHPHRAIMTERLKALKEILGIQP